VAVVVVLVVAGVVAVAAVATAAAAAAAAALRADVLANPGLSAKESAAQLLTAHLRPASVGQLHRTVRRAVRSAGRVGRVLDYLRELDSEEFFVDVVADDFKSYFEGIVAALKILKEGGLDYFCYIRRLPPVGKAAADHKRKAGRRRSVSEAQALVQTTEARPRGGAGADAAHDATDFVDLSDLM
jgi:hypothetical protein